MSVLVNFNGSQILEPGNYSRITAGFVPPAPSSTYGDVVLIDTGSGKGFGFGGSINGELTNGEDAVYEFATALDAKKAIRGGILYDLMDYLWNPAPDSKGPRRLIYVRAATTTAPRLTLNFGDGSTPETKAHGTITYTDFGTAGMAQYLYVQRPSGAWDYLGRYISTSGNIAAQTQGVADLINGGTLQHGYTATVTSGTLNIIAPANLGATMNGAGISVYKSDPIIALNYVNFTGGVNAIISSLATLVLANRIEGVAGNGVLLNGTITRGHGVKLRTGVINSTKFFLEFYEGTYRGQDTDSVEYEGGETTVRNNAIYKTAEVSNVQQLVDWMNSDNAFKDRFKVVSATGALSSAITSFDIAAIGVNITPFAGGTINYNPTDVDDALAALEDYTNSLFICDNWGYPSTPDSGQVLAGANKGAECTANLKILAHTKTNAKYSDKVLFIGAGKDKTQYAQSKDTAALMDDEGVVLAHSDILVAAATAGDKYANTFYHAAMICGALAGLEPQVPITQKAIRVKGVKHLMKKAERENALVAGVLHLRKENGHYVVNEGINTLQRNGTIYNADGTSFRISTKRIKHQLNKELKIGAAAAGFAGSNVGTTDAEDVKIFTENFLQERCVVKSPFKDNLIINYRDVKPVYANGSWDTTYCFTVNEEIAKTFHTGYILDPNVEINKQS